MYPGVRYLCPLGYLLEWLIRSASPKWPRKFKVVLLFFIATQVPAKTDRDTSSVAAGTGTPSQVRNPPGLDPMFEYPLGGDPNHFSSSATGALLARQSPVVYHNDRVQPVGDF